MHDLLRESRTRGTGRDGRRHGRPDGIGVGRIAAVGFDRKQGLVDGGGDDNAHASVRPLRLWYSPWHGDLALLWRRCRRVLVRHGSRIRSTVQKGDLLTPYAKHLGYLRAKWYGVFEGCDIRRGPDKAAPLQCHARARAGCRDRHGPRCPASSSQPACHRNRHQRSHVQRRRRYAVVRLAERCGYCGRT